MKLSKEVSGGEEQSISDKASIALQPLKLELMGGLDRQLEQAGPIQAVEYCKHRAQPITKKFQGRMIEVGRTSLRVRNPLNAPEPWMDEILHSYDSSTIDSPSPPRVVELEANLVAYVEPIYVKNMCLDCHGSYINKSVQSKLDEKYLQDQAINYSEGEFRGLWWVKIKLNHK